jgi:hypothetical protein
VARPLGKTSRRHEVQVASSIPVSVCRWEGYVHDASAVPLPHKLTVAQGISQKTPLERITIKSLAHLHTVYVIIVIFMVKTINCTISALKNPKVMHF